MTALNLTEHWRSSEQSAPGSAIPFYDNYHAGEPYASLNNWFTHDEFSFEVPSLMLPEGFPSTIACSTSEKAIMLCKAAVMGDRESYDAISATEDGAELQRLGREVQPYDRELWRAVICAVASSAIGQKFAKVPGLA